MSIKLGVIGCPIHHSLSPIIHNYWLEYYGIKGEYKSIEIHPDNLCDFLKDKLGDYVGLNVTTPHKHNVFKSIYTQSTHSSSQLEAANIINVTPEGNYTLNSDAKGFANNLYDIAGSRFQPKKAMLLGAGGAARAIAHSLFAPLCIEQLVIANRTIAKAILIRDNLLNHFPDASINIIDWQEKENYLNDIDLLVNSTSLGMVGQPELSFNLKYLPKTAVVADIVYSPLQTNLLKQAKNRGNIIVDGLGMLIHQAALSFEVWFKIKPVITEELQHRILLRCFNKK